jgi:hypothetical protein
LVVSASRLLPVAVEPRQIAGDTVLDLCHAPLHLRALVKFLSQLFATLNLLPSIATVVSVNSDPLAKAHAFDGHRMRGMRGPNCGITSSLRSATVVIRRLRAVEVSSIATAT